ncbi:SusC/RagA family TonB-linked outer membrane protein [Niabella hirudinis]|uniref:SusC/RagA family TonB-linked outer membrane protein n=1 Tax=Niabella hirudinis TaxID=1285929 RepID=UPI003EBE4E51
MKLSAIFLVLALQVSATNYGQRVLNLKEENISLAEVLKKIEKQSDYRFFYSNDLIPSKEFISINVVNASLNDVMLKVLKDAALNWKLLENNEVVIMEEKTDALGMVQPPRRMVTGSVKNDKGEPLAGVSITEKGTDNGTMTNELGNFTIDVANDAAVLVISDINYETLEVRVSEIGDGAIILKAIEKKLDEVVVVGYGSNVKRNLLQSVSSLSAGKVAEIPVATLSQSLAGRLPGLFVTQSGGKPGRSSSIRVRAYDGFGPAQPPLFVIDGLIVDQFAFDGLDASEVENISVLKDGAAASVYGVRGANGVILVTTKKGAKGAPKINFISSYSLDHPTKIPDVLTAYEQGKIVNDNLKLTQPTSYQTNSLFAGDDELEYWKTHSVNMVKQYYKDPTELRNTLNISGGSEKMSYFLSGSYYKGTGTFDNIDYQKYNVRARVDAEIAKNLTVTLNLSSDIRKDLKPFWRYDNDGDDMVDFYRGLLIRGGMGPDYITVNGVAYPVGNFLKWHPGEVVNGHTGYNRKKFSNNEILVDATYKVPFVTGLKLRGAFATYSRNDFRKQLNLPYNLYVFQPTGSRNHLLTDQLDLSKTFQRNDGNWVNENYVNGNFYQLNLYMNYDRSFGQHNLAVMAGYEQSETFNHNFFAQNQNVISRDLDQISLAGNDPNFYSVNGGEFQEGRLAALGRIGYNYAGKYLMEAAFRYEGSRYFIPSNRYAFFPSLSAGWRISDERFFKDNVPFVNDLKLRASLGLTGEEPRIRPDGSVRTELQWDQYYYKASGAIFGGVTNGVVIGTLPNPNITWAKKRSIDLGIDATMLNNKLSLTANYFKNRRTDILGNRIQSIPTTFGGILPLENYGILESHGYEFDLGYRTNLTGDLNFSASVNYAYATNKQVLIDQAANIRPYQSQLGRPVGGIMGYIATGVIKTQAELDALPAGYTINGATPRLGMLNFKDIRGATSDSPDGRIDGNDQEFIAKYNAPPASYGLTLGATWRSLSFDIFIQGVSSYYRVRSTTALFITHESTNFGFWRDYWSPENPDGNYPLNTSGGAGNTSTFWLDNASFIRLKNANIGWALPAKAIKSIGLQSVKLFFNGSNLFLFKDKTKWYDPEGILQGYPINRNFTFGVNASL